MEYVTDRGDLYGDGFFESIAVFNGKSPLLPWHYSRLVRTAEFLRIILPGEYSDSKLLALNIAHWSEGKSGRLRLTLIRSGGGMYLPESNQAKVLTEFLPHDNLMNHQQLHKNNIEFADNNYTYPGPFSQYKLIAKTDRVLLALENQDRLTEDLIVCDPAGNISEAIASNIFFMKSPDTIYTPRLAHGCLDGVMRRALIDLVPRWKLDMVEDAVHRDDLSGYQSCFLTNAIQGIVPVARIGKWKFELELAQNLGEKLRLQLQTMS